MPGRRRLCGNEAIAGADRQVFIETEADGAPDLLVDRDTDVAPFARRAEQVEGDFRVQPETDLNVGPELGIAVRVFRALGGRAETAKGNQSGERYGPEQGAAHWWQGYSSIHYRHALLKQLTM